MKNCDEMVDSLLERRDQYLSEQKRKKKVIARTATSAFCVCLVALFGFGALQSGVVNTPLEPTMDDVNPGVVDTLDEDKSKSTNLPSTSDYINIQNIENLPDSNYMNIALMWDDFICMDHDEINEYYGVNIFPTVPNDLVAEEETFGIFKRKSTGELYWDTNELNYFNEDYSRSVSVSVDKDCVPFDFVNLFDSAQSKSVINDIEVGIAQTPYGELYAEFTFGGVGFRVVTSGLTQEELVSIVSSLIN